MNGGSPFIVSSVSCILGSVRHIPLVGLRSPSSSTVYGPSIRQGYWHMGESEAECSPSSLLGAAAYRASSQASCPTIPVSMIKRPGLGSNERIET